MSHGSLAAALACRVVPGAAATIPEKKTRFKSLMLMFGVAWVCRYHKLTRDTMTSKYYSRLHRHDNQLKHLVTAEVKPPISDLANSRINRLRKSLYHPDHGFKEC